MTRVHLLAKKVDIIHPSVEFAQVSALQRIQRTKPHATIDWRKENGYLCGYVDEDVPTFIIQEK